MISLGSSDGRKGLGLGLGLGFAGVREMEEAELEEGEACFYQNDQDSTLDPDVALSYIDEKLEHVLGHFQKDFEGGVSAENLGSKFGGYGSFLPTYQRSPVCSHPVQNYNASRSPISLPLEGARGNSVSSSASTSARLVSASVGVSSFPVSRAASVDDCVKQEVTVPVINAEYKSDNQSDQKTFKVRIKMGSDNLATQKIAEIYSGLGLDVSPTSSFEDSPTDTEMSREPCDCPDESPTSILEIMTSFPVHGSLLLSPLHEDLIYLTDKQMLFRESRSVPVRYKGSQESSLISLNGSDSGRCDKKPFGEKKPKPSKRRTELENNNANNKQDEVNVQLKKETYTDTSACDELVSNALRLPLLSSSYCSVVDSAKDTATARVDDASRLDNKSGMKEESFSDLAKDEQMEPAPIQENGCIKKPNGNHGSAVNVSEFKKAKFYEYESGCPENRANLKGEIFDDSSKVDSNMFKVKKNSNDELMDHAKHKAGQKAVSSVDDDMKVSSGKENSFGSKSKSKRRQSHSAEIITELRNGDTKTDTTSAPKSRKNVDVNTCLPDGEVGDIRQDIVMLRDRYKEFFGDLELELGENEINDDMPSVVKSTNCSVFNKSNGEFNSISKERSDSKKIDRPSTSEAYRRVSSSGVPPVGNRPVYEAAAPVAPLVQEDWVCCDKCQTWRLLPAGKDPQSLPKIWLCSMLDWLDGMNRCSFSEEETTKAVLSLHQTFAPGLAPVPEGQISQYRSGVESSGVVDAPHIDQSLQDIGGKKKHGFKDVLSASSQNASSPYSNSKKKIPQASVKSRSLNGENHSRSLNEVDFQHSGQSSGLVAQKRRHKKKEKNKSLATYPGEGNTQSMEIGNKRDTDQDFSKASKKFKAIGVYADEDWKSDNGGAAVKVGQSSSLSINKTGKHSQKYDLSKESKRHSKVSVRNLEDQTQFSSDARLLHMGDYIDGDMKKRKINEYQDTQLYTTSRAVEGHRLEDHRIFREETSESNHHKEKKARMSKSGGKESSMSKGSGGIDKKGRSLKDEQPGVDLENNLSRRSLDSINLVKKDTGSTQPPIAATSSSSKVSGSNKSKANLEEVKGSPMESVSSSPLRVFNQDKFTSIRKCSDREDGAGSDQSRMVQKNVIIAAANRDSLESSMLDLQDRDQSQISRRKALAEAISSPEVATQHVSDILQADQYPCKPLAEQCPNDESGKRSQYHTNGSHRISGKGSSSRSKDKNRGIRSESEKGNVKTLDSNGYADHSSYDENRKASCKLQEKIALVSVKVENNISSKNDPAANPLAESSKREAQSNRGYVDGSDVSHIISNHDSKDLLLECNDEKASRRFPSDKTDRVDVSGKGKSHSLPPSGRCQNEMSRWPQPVNGFQKDNGGNISSAEASEGVDAMKASKQIKSENQSGSSSQPINSRAPIIGHKVRDIDSPNPVRRDSSSQAASKVVKEAKDLKHLADRLKNSGSSLESTVFYFQAALKFLHGACLLESSNSEKHGEMIQSMQMYSSTAKLCEFCAHEYEKSKDMASAALAYKCVEVAYLRVINSSHSSASKDRIELQTALQIVPPGESPSSSASDVDNLNNPVTVDKVNLTKGANSPQVTGNHVIPAQNRPNLVRLLNFAQDVNFAMEASRKSRIAFVAAKSRLEDTKSREGMSSVRKALDFNFQDVDGLLRLIRFAMEAISR